MLQSCVYIPCQVRIGCWNVRSLGSLSGQSNRLIACLRSMKEKRIGLLALSESCWPRQGVSRIHSTTILHCGTPSAHIHGDAIALSPQARLSWEAASSVFIPTSCGSDRDASPADPCCAISMAEAKVPGATTWRLLNMTTHVHIHTLTH